MCRCFFISALSETEDKVRGFEVGGLDFITKPFHTDEVLARVKMHMTLRRLQLEMHDQNLKLLNEVEERKRIEQELEAANTELELLASLDGLTHIPNRRKFNLTLEREWSRLSRSGEPLSLILCDVDHFKKYNDHYGHVDGDECLKKVAQAIASAVSRPADVAARYGGEEFAVMMPDTVQEGAIAVAEVIKEGIHNLAIPHATSDVSSTVTLSLGVVTIYPDITNTPETIILAADRLLYQAKETGRDSIISGEQ